MVGTARIKARIRWKVFYNPEQRDGDGDADSKASTSKNGLVLKWPHFHDKAE